LRRLHSPHRPGIYARQHPFSGGERILALEVKILASNVNQHFGGRAISGAHRGHHGLTVKLFVVRHARAVCFGGASIVRWYIPMGPGRPISTRRLGTGVMPGPLIGATSNSTIGPITSRMRGGPLSCSCPRRRAWMDSTGYLRCRTSPSPLADKGSLTLRGVGISSAPIDGNLLKLRIAGRNEVERSKN